MQRLALHRRICRAPWAAQPKGSATGKRFFAAGAQFNRLTSDWIRSASTPDLEVRADLRVLRRRARELVRDNSYARRFTRILTKNIVGPHGIRPVPTNLGAGGSAAKKANLALAQAWADWSMPEYASTDSLHSWTELEGLIIRSVATDGEVFLRLWPGFDNDYGFAVELLDPDLLDEQFNREASSGQTEIRMGIERDRFRRPINYHFWKNYPNAPSGALNERIPIPASEIIHLFAPLRVGQSRGISWFAPVLLDLKMLDGYQEAELIAARTAAAKMGFFVTKDPNNATQLPPDTGQGERMVMEASAGMAEELPPGMEFQAWDPQHPNSAYDAFEKAILRQQAAGLDTSYMSLTGDLSETSFSSGRIGVNDERDGYEIWQLWLATHCHRRVYRAWLPHAMLSPNLSLPSYDAARWLACTWHARDWDYIEPLKDVQTLKEEIGLGVNSRTRHLRKKGMSYEDILGELAEETAAADAAGVNISGVPAAAPKSGDDEKDATDTTTTDNAKSGSSGRALRAVR